MDERLTNIEAQKQAQLEKNDALYSGLLSDAQNLYNQQQNYASQYENTQNDILNKQLEYSTNLIEQQKDIARQNARTEQNKARNDYNAFINPYGKQAESLASQGLATSGLSETTKLGGYNTYQNRLASANKVLQDAITQYDNDINQARLNNDVSKAQNALEKLKLQLQYSESYYNKKGEYQQNQFATGRDIDTDYFNRYQTEYSNIQNEKARQEAIRQWEAEMAYKRERDAIEDAQWERQYALSKANASSGSGGYSLSDGGNSLSDYSDDYSKASIPLNAIFVGSQPNNISTDSPVYTKDGKYYVQDNNGDLIDITDYYKAMEETGNTQYWGETVRR